MSELEINEWFGTYKDVSHKYHFSRVNSRNSTMITALRDAAEPRSIEVPDRGSIRFVTTLLTEGAPKADPDMMHVPTSTKLKWESFKSHQMGRGFVAMRQSEQEKAAGEYDPHPVLIHQNAENTDPDVMRVVENECAMLAYLLDKFRFDNSFISEHAKSCSVEEPVLYLRDLSWSWKALIPGKYRISGTFLPGPVHYNLHYELGDVSSTLFLHVLEPTLVVDETLLEKEVIATVMKLPDGSAVLMSAGAC